MLRNASRVGRAAGLLGAALVAGAVLTAAGNDVTATAPAAATGPATAAPAADPGAADLARALLPADAFGPDAVVIPMPTDRSRTAGDLTGALAFSQITPESCATALRQILPQMAAVSDTAGQMARSGDTVTAELLARPAAGLDAVGQLTALREACTSAQVSAPGYGTGTGTVTPLAVPALHDGVAAAGVSVAVETSGPDGRSWSGTALAALVQDGDHVLVLARMAPSGAAVDPGAFDDLLRQAYQTQAATLD